MLTPYFLVSMSKKLEFDRDVLILTRHIHEEVVDEVRVKQNEYDRRKTGYFQRV
jgi:hypothetical protein